MTEQKRGRVHRMAACAVMAAVICVLAPIAVPVGPVPFTVGTLAIYLTAYLLGGAWGTASTLVYLLVGLVGAPVFSGYMGGPSRLAGPTGGYLVGYLPMALLMGAVVQWSCRRFAGEGKKGAAAALTIQFFGLAAGTAVLYAFGTAWYCVQAEAELSKALAGCLYPFIPIDLAKIAVTLAVGMPVRRRLEQARLL